MALLDTVDPDGLEEFSVVFTDRSLNHMSKAFQQVMLDINAMLKEVYKAEATALIPGGGTYAMEAVARQFARGQDALVVRNGWFSYRWSQIFEAGGLTKSATVMKARQTGNSAQSPFAPAPIEEVIAAIREQKPAIVFAPHVETAAGVILPDDYVTQMATLDEYLVQNPKAAHVYFLRGYHFLFLGHKEAARDDLAKAVELESRDRLAGELLVMAGGTVPEPAAVQPPAPEIIPTSPAEEAGASAES